MSPRSRCDRRPQGLSELGVNGCNYWTTEGDHPRKEQKEVKGWTGSLPGLKWRVYLRYVTVGTGPRQNLQGFESLWRSSYGTKSLCSSFTVCPSGTTDGILCWKEISVPGSFSNRQKDQESPPFMLLLFRLIITSATGTR